MGVIVSVLSKVKFDTSKIGYLESKPEDYPRGSQDQDIFRYIEPKFYPRIKVDYQNLMAYRS